MDSSFTTLVYDWEECEQSLMSYSFPKQDKSPQKERRNFNYVTSPKTPTIQESESETGDLWQSQSTPLRKDSGRKKLIYNQYHQPRTVSLSNASGSSSDLSQRPHLKHQASPTASPRRVSAADSASSPRRTHRRSFSLTGSMIQDDLAGLSGSSNSTLRSPISSVQSSPKLEPAMTDENAYSPLLDDEKHRLDSFSFGQRPKQVKIPKELIDLDDVDNMS
ncbi:hypothetical protein OGAPHI_005790 [Ogataea philodendri]|uniref:Uncharacterized protein n=1 Tax=Ogataea philodendri TaxID=1378263 RepID=A0A9P8T188_9ASCO|nr:uncharacterized protein OGAPHI_005790 [Ogataea philodendri]KAH3662538.1 hypothetical protein OGAPHI_005790 [Ogataea philodendri]